MILEWKQELCQAREDDKTASIIQVKVTGQMYPDEDFVRQALKLSLATPVDICDYQELADLSLAKLGNVAVRPGDLRVISCKDFDLVDMASYSDPTITLINYTILGLYYRRLMKTFWTGEDLASVERY